MSTIDDNLTPEEGAKLAAAEYVLGVMSASERWALEQRLTREPALVEDVAFWEQRLGTFVDEIAPLTPPDQVWSRIEQVVTPPPPPPPREGFWQSLAFWRPFGIGSALIATASLGAIIYVTILPAPRSPMMAMLESSGGQASFTAAYVPGRQTLVLVPATLVNSERRTLELWLIPPGDRPHSLGLIEPGKPVRIQMPPALVERLTNSASLAVSLEPAGGSPTGLPTGAVVASGKLINL
jgi:anti-sigma-K factor RskA